VPELVELVLVVVPWPAVLSVLVVPELVVPCGAAPDAGGVPLHAMAAAGAIAATAATAPVASAMRVLLNVIRSSLWGRGHKEDAATGGFVSPTR
jgi:hypothetical protein